MTKQEVVEKNGIYYAVYKSSGYYKIQKLRQDRRIDRKANAILIDNEEEFATYKTAGVMIAGLFKIVSPSV
jgi:hypothetical protein